ncbi:hypothetical protein GJ744_002771 [Endocarpon pusillum]|uniref:Heterokaryon incompatibility domain-containing protein n=1 Tax=Endocarpon pusillum TaxID=364733 RepID=A0A8H7AMZ3_9EURO|nr:hypothetical protein GJ744_002771 [Endocarpon pusillum]
MEHLFSHREDASNYPLVTIKEIPNPVILEYKQQESEPVPFFEPKTPYLGFHTARSKTAASNLSDYASTCEIDTEKLWNGDLRGSSQELKGMSGADVSFHVASFIQGWLYFGLLESVLSTRVEASYLVRRDPDHDRRPFLYTRGLLCCLHHEVFKDLSEDQRKSVGWNIVNEIGFARKWMTRFVSWGSSNVRHTFDREYPTLNEILDCILPSIVRLAEAIEMARILSFGDHEATLWGVRSFPYPFRESEQQAAKLQRLGWCRFQIDYLQNTVNRSSVEWIITTELNQEPAGHETCTSMQCDRNNVNSSTYEQSHITEGCGCSALKPDTQQVIQILRNDDIPIMVLYEARGEIEVEAMGRSTLGPEGYLAISHVWADGLGGSTEKGLLQCQARRLLKLLSPFEESKISAHFWLDTLCIPRSDPDAYMAALVGIRTVYLDARVVVVLDRMIQACSIRDPWVSLFARIHLSPWMQRMWTYEEAVLAKRLVFVLKDSMFGFDLGMSWPDFDRALKVVARSFGKSLITLRGAEMDIGIIDRAFRYRLTNARDEEFLSVAGILGLDTAELLKVRGEARTCRFWLLLKHVPKQAAFHEGPKLTAPGFRWAPRTLMCPGPAFMRGLPNDETECTTEGLIGSFGMIRHESLPFSPWVFTIEFGGAFPDGTDDKLQQLVVKCVRDDEFKDLTIDNVSGFDHIVFLSPDQSMPMPGSPVSAITVRQLDQTVPGKDIKKYQYIGRILCERRANNAQAITFEGLETRQTEKTADAIGYWVMEKICLT